jgi:AcrR family transcriptional regulator
MTAADNGPRIDGRRMRSKRTRQLIIDAYLAIVRERGQTPTAAQIAERAGYSVRSVFERFPDLGALRLAVTDQAIADIRAQEAPRDMEADRATRLRSQVKASAQTCEKWLPLWRVMTSDQQPAAEILERIKMIRELAVRRVESSFEVELKKLSEVERRHTLIAIEAMTEFESWARMREFFDLSFDEACEVWIGALNSLVPATPADS